MNVFKIAWRSIQHRGLGSFLTMLSMALGVMMVVAVLTIHGVVSQSFKNNNSFGYNILVGARGGGLQLTLNTVYYLSKPVENIPYEYYLAFCDAETRQHEMQNSIAYIAKQHEAKTLRLANQTLAELGGPGASLAGELVAGAFDYQQSTSMKNSQPGLYHRYTDIAVPICLGDYYVDEATGAAYRCVGTKPDFFEKLVLDVDTEEKFSFSKGRSFEEYGPEHGLYECVIGATVANRCGLKLGDTVKPTHGDPASPGAHIHEQPFTIVGIIDRTGTPHDRVVFLNMEGFFLMEGHTKSVEDDSLLAIKKDDESEQPEELDAEAAAALDASLRRVRLPIEQREVTAVLVRTSRDDPYGTLATFLPPQINQGDLETVLDWTPYRPERSQKAAQAVNPIQEITGLFQIVVDPIRLMLLALTLMICIVSAISILVGIYNSMSQRRQELAVLRALGAGRLKVFSIMLSESILLACVGGLMGWVAGHGLNALLSPVVEDRTGVSIGFFSFAPGIPVGYLLGGLSLPAWLQQLSVSPEFLLIPGLILLAVIVGIYPAITAYRTDVSKSLGK